MGFMNDFGQSLTLTVRLIKSLLYMNVGTELQDLIPQNQNAQIVENINELIVRLAAESLRSSQKIFHPQAYQTIMSKFNKINLNTPLPHFLQEFLAILFNFLNKFPAQSSKQQWNDAPKITTNDYKILQKALQKSQGQIRKHYKVEQQLKIYLDNLQDKIQQLQDKLELESQKYLLLFQTFKELDQNHQKLLEKMESYNQQQTNSNFNPFQSIQVASNENIASRKTKLGLRNKMLMQKLQQRTRKISNKNKNKILNITDDDINVHQQTNKMIYNRNSMDRYKKNPNQTEIRQLTKSLQMKQGISVDNYKRKVSKIKTESNQRQGRSNSILN